MPQKRGRIDYLGKEEIGPGRGELDLFLSFSFEKGEEENVGEPREGDEGCCQPNEGRLQTR